MVILNAWLEKSDGSTFRLGSFLKVRKAVRAGEAYAGSSVASFTDNCWDGEVAFTFYLENGDKITVMGW